MAFSSDRKKFPSMGVLAVFCVLLMVAPGTPGRAQAVDTVGMIVDDAGVAHVFDADTDTVLGSVNFDPGMVAGGDCSITADQALGFVTDTVKTQDSPIKAQVRVIDLSDPSSPALASASGDPIEVSNLGIDTALSPDGKFLLVCDGFASAPVSVVEVAQGLEVSTFSLGAGTTCTSVDACTDGSVLVTDSTTGEVRRLTLDGSGNLSDTGENLATGSAGVDAGPNNVACAPDGSTGITVSRDLRELRSFTSPGLVSLDTQGLAGGQRGNAVIFNGAGDRVYARSANAPGAPESMGFVEFFLYNPSNGMIDPLDPLVQIEVRNDLQTVGVDSIALHPDGSKLYVSEPFITSEMTPGIVNVYDASTGGLLHALTDEAGALVTPTGICFPTPLADGPGQFEFTSFEGKLDIDLTAGPDNDVVNINSTFALDEDSDGIDPENETVTLTVGGEAVVIPVGSFVKKTTPVKEFFTFAGFVGIVSVDLKIEGLGGGSYELKGTVSNLNLDGVTNPVLVGLTIGNDSGSFEADASIN